MPTDPYSRYKNEFEARTSDKKYPNPFFDLANNMIPSNIKTLFKYCHAFFHTDPFLSNVVRKLTEYPLTEILYQEGTDDKTKAKYDVLLHEKLKINSLLIEIGLDYYTYGNCFISMFMKTKRYLVHPRTNERIPIDKAKYEYKAYKFNIWDDVTKSFLECEVEDDPINSIESLRLVRWNPENIDISYNPITGESVYYYEIPNDLKKSIVSGDKHIIATTPLIFLEAVKNKKRVVLDNKTFYHFKRPGLSESDMGWGKPVVLSALKKIYYLQVLQRGNEAIAHEHIVPKKAISPANTATLDPLTQLNLPKWTGEMESTIKKWRQDPNYIAVFPIPIGYQELGGNARGLMLTPEMRFLEENIINSLGVPIEFIKGGASWTGSSISLRIVENMFLTYRGLLLDFVNHFLLPRLHFFLGYPEVKVRFKDFKMADDSQQKQLMLQLSEMGKVSDQKLLDLFGLSSQSMEKELDDSVRQMSEQQARAQIMQAEAQGQGNVILAKYQVRAQIEATREQLKQRLLKLQEEVQKEQGGVDMDYMSLIENIAVQLMYLPPEQQIGEMEKLRKQAPTTHGLVMELVQAYTQGGVMPDIGSPRGPGNPNVKRNPPNKKSPGEREGNKVEITEERTKANTRGEAS